MVAILAIDVALGSRKESPDKNGALHTIAEHLSDSVLRGLLAVGLGAYAVWQISLAIDDREDEGEDTRGSPTCCEPWPGRAGTASSLADGLDPRSGNGSGSSNEQHRTAGIFDHTADAAHTSSTRPDLPVPRGGWRNASRAIT